jgi:protein-L-isoaspartate(D-aspartate) O-methyltransferase
LALRDRDIAYDCDPSALRRIYARQLLARAGVSQDPALENAFAAIPREDFLGPPPWELHPTYPGREPCTTSDPFVLYQDSLVTLQGHRSVNNGCPGLHAALLHAVGVRAGERVAHIGAGGGYYSAILSRIVGPEGRVTAVEFDAELAELARRALSEFSNVTVIHGDGAHWPEREADVVYVNFGAGQPAKAWVEALAPNGRLIFPLVAAAPEPMPGSVRQGGKSGSGLAILITRREKIFAARALGSVNFVLAEGDLAISQAENDRLFATLQKRTARHIRRLFWRETITDAARCWHVGSDWALGSDDP